MKTAHKRSNAPKQRATSCQHLDRQWNIRVDSKNPAKHPDRAINTLALRLNHTLPPIAIHCRSMDTPIRAATEM